MLLEGSCQQHFGITASQPRTRFRGCRDELAAELPQKHYLKKFEAAMIYHTKRLTFPLLTLALVGGNSSSTMLAQSSTPAPASASAPARGQASAPAKPAKGAPGHYEPNRVARRAEMYYVGVWGVDSFNVKAAESGELIRFTWRVVDPARAKPLNDKKTEPFLVDPQAGVKLVVPTMEKVGQLRQSSTPEAGKSYWMAFSNAGRRVKRGDHVNVVIGQFHADGLIVE